MSAVRTTIPVLGFRAGEFTLAIAAEDVLAVEDSPRDAVHVAELLAVEPDEKTDARRLIRVQDRSSMQGKADTASFAADPPVEILLCRDRDILPTNISNPFAFRHPVMGAAHIDSRLLLLLDISGLVRMLRKLRTGEEL